MSRTRKAAQPGAEAPPETRLGRPTRCTPELTAALCADIEKGAPEQVCCDANGIGRSTFHEWMQRGRGGEQPFADFADAVTRARGTMQVNLVAEIRRAVLSGQFGGDDWRARAWLLEHTNRLDFGIKVEVTQRVEGTFSHVLDRLRAELDPGTFGRVLEIVSRALGESGAGTVDDVDRDAG